MSVTCPEGHTSESRDYCDVCGSPIGAAGDGADGGGRATPAATVALQAPADTGLKPCPNCGADNPGDALFCEDCGYDFTTGALPPPPLTPPTPDLPDTPVPAPDVAVSPPPEHPAPDPRGGAAPTAAHPPSTTVDWVAEVWVDPDWYATQDSQDPCPSAGMPVVVPLTGQSLLVGRRSVSRNITPQIDCGTDTGVSRRHAQLTTDGTRWWIEDLQSSNGTYLGAAGAALPTAPLPLGQRVEFSSGDRIYLGAWTRLVVRRALPGEGS